MVIWCGAWSPLIARMAGASIPLTPMVHQMIDIGPAPRFADAKGMIEFPIVRDMDENMYERQEGTGLEIGSYAHRPIMVDPDDIPSIDESALTPTELPFTQDDFEPQMEIALELMPEIVGDETVGVKYAINGVLSVTYDGMPLLGETPGGQGPVVGGRGLDQGGARRRQDRRRADGRMASPRSTSTTPTSRALYSHQRTTATSSPAPRRASTRCTGSFIPASSGSPTAGSGCRRSTSASRRSVPCSSRPPAGSGRSGTSQTRRCWRSTATAMTRREAEWDSRWWSPIINAEHLAMRDRAGMSTCRRSRCSTSSAPGRSTSVQRVAMRQMDVAHGRVVYTPLLTPSGGFRQDLTIMRLGDDSSGSSPAVPTGCRT